MISSGARRPARSNESRFPAAQWALAIYALLTAVAAFGGAAMSNSPVDASIGGSMLLGTVGVLGLPWSLMVFFADDGLSGNVWSVLLYVVFAVVNGALALRLLRLLDRRFGP